MTISTSHASFWLYAGLWASLSILAACGGDGDDSGSGTGTLSVIADGVITEDFTDVALDLRARGIPVIDAEITLEDVNGGQRVVAERRQEGFYLGRLVGAVTVLRVTIEAGEDRLEAGIGGPEEFVITRPPDDALVRVGSAERLRLEWSRPEDEPIDEVELAVIDANDNVVSSERLSEDPGQGRVVLPTVTGRFRAVVRRTDVVLLAGGTEGSKLSLERSARARFELTP